MGVMTSVAWIGVMFLAAVVIRAKVKVIGDMLVPACMIAGVIGFAFMNTVGLEGAEFGSFTTISGQLYTFLFINLGLTLGEKKSKEKREKISSLQDLRSRMGDSMFSGIFGMGSFWALAYAFQPLIGFGLLTIFGKIWDMNPTYGLLIPFGFAQGPGQAVTYGAIIEEAGWENAIQVAMLFAAVGFLIAFIFGVPFAKKGIRKGIASSNVEMGEELTLGFVEPEGQRSYGKETTYGGNLDVLTFHVALIGLAWILGLQIGKLWGLIPGYFGQLFSKLLFFNGMLAGYGIRYVLGKLGVTKYLDRGTQIRITNASTDIMVAATFMAINLQIVGKWVAPILIICIVTAIATWVAIRYFGARFGGSNDFERTLGEWGTATGTNATGLSLVRIVDPNNETTTAAELGPANAVNVPASYIVAPAICSFAAGSMSTGTLLVSLFGIIAAYLVFMRLIGVWGKKTYDINKGEKYRDGQVYMRNGKPVDQ